MTLSFLPHFSAHLFLIHFLTNTSNACNLDMPILFLLSISFSFSFFMIFLFPHSNFRLLLPLALLGFSSLIHNGGKEKSKMENILRISSSRWSPETHPHQGLQSGGQGAMVTKDFHNGDVYIRSLSYSE